MSRITPCNSGNGLIPIKFNIKSANHRNRMKLTLQVESNMLNPTVTLKFLKYNFQGRNSRRLKWCRGPNDSIFSPQSESLNEWTFEINYWCATWFFAGYPPPPSSEGVRLSAHQTAGPCGWLIIDSAGLLVTWREHKPPAADDIQISIRPPNRTLKFHIINFYLFSNFFWLKQRSKSHREDLMGIFLNFFLNSKLDQQLMALRGNGHILQAEGNDAYKMWCLPSAGGCVGGFHSTDDRWRTFYSR